MECKGKHFTFTILIWIDNIMAFLCNLEPIYKVWDEDGLFCYGTVDSIVLALNDYYADNKEKGEAVRKVTKENWEKELDTCLFNYKQIN